MDKNAADSSVTNYVFHLISNSSSPAMDEESSWPQDCSNSDNITKCYNESIPPPNACICELASTQFTPEYATFNLILIVIILPAVAVFGVITNALSFFVYTRTHMLRSSTNYYLAALAISDIIVDFCGISSIAIDSARQFDPLLNEIHLAIIPYTLPLCYIAQMCSVYFTVLAAFDCYLLICGPDPTTTVVVSNRRLSTRICLSRNTAPTIYIATVVIVSLLYNCITFADLHVVECVDYSHPESPNVLKKEICPTDLRLDPIYSQIYKVYMYAVFMTFLPFAILLTLNCLIIWKIYRMSPSKKAPRLTINRDSITSTAGDGRTNDVDNVDSTGDSTIMLVMVVALFLICNSIALVVNIIETFGNYPMEDADAANRLFFVIDVGNFLVVFNSSANFLIYYAFSKAFRAVLMRRRQKLPGGRLASSHSSLNTQYYLASSSITLNADVQTPHNDLLHHQRRREEECQKEELSSVEATAQAIAAITMAISLAPPTPTISLSAPQFLNVKNGRMTKNSRGGYELLSVTRVSPAPTKANDDHDERGNRAAERENGVETSIDLEAEAAAS